MESTAQEIAQSSFFSRIDISQRKHPSLHEESNLFRVNAVVFSFTAMDGFHIESMAENELNVILGTEIRQPIPGKGALGPDNEIVLIGLKDF